MQFEGREYQATRASARFVGDRFYFTGVPCPAGHVALRYSVSCKCCSCRQAASTKRYAAGYRPPPRNAEVVTEYRRSGRQKVSLDKWKLADPKRAWATMTLSNLRARSKRKGRPCDVTIAYLKTIMVDRCPALGYELVYGNPAGVATANSASVDKMIPALGYVQGNLSIISHRANLIKSDASADEVSAVARWLTSLEG